MKRARQPLEHYFPRGSGPCWEAARWQHRASFCPGHPAGLCPLLLNKPQEQALSNSGQLGGAGRVQTLALSVVGIVTLGALVPPPKIPWT